MKQTAFILSVFLLGCTSVSEDSIHSSSPPFAGIKDGHLVYEGELTAESNKSIFKAFKLATNKPTQLLISSIGGEIGLGIELGRWVRENELDIEVTNICGSSCANYVFTAAKTKYLRKDSVIVWHGCAWQKDWDVDDEFKESFKEYLNGVRAEETEFFASIAVDNALCIYGQSKISFWDKLRRDYVGYDYSLNDMKKFGINNILLIDIEWNWRKYKPTKSEQVKRVKLDGEYHFKLRRFET